MLSRWSLLAAAMLAMHAVGKNVEKPKKIAKDFTSDERRVETKKCAGRREVARARVATTKLDEERHKANEHIIVTRVETNG
jgi:hypothetical protein